MTLAEAAATDLRDCRLYRFYGWDPRTNYTTKTLIYIGETARQPLARLLEHVEGKPWADTITSWEVDDRVFAGKVEVLAAEAEAIRDERPLYNVKENMANPRRVPPWDQESQRWARDDAAGRRRWVKPAEGVRRPPSRMGAPADPVRRVPAVAARQWAPWQQKTALWSTSWVLLSSLAWGLVGRIDRASDTFTIHTRTHVVVSVLAAGAGLVWAVLHKPRRRRRRR